LILAQYKRFHLQKFRYVFKNILHSNKNIRTLSVYIFTHYLIYMEGSSLKTWLIYLYKCVFWQHYFEVSICRCRS